MQSETVAQLSATLEELIRRLRTIAVAGGISPTAAATLRTLNLTGARRISDLAESEQVSQPAMTQLLHRMELDGLVERRVPETNRRTTLVSLTLLGQSVLQARQQQRHAALHDLLDALPESDQSAIETALPSLQRLAEIPTATPVDTRKRHTVHARNR